MAQALQIPRVSEQRPVALVVPDVVHVGGLGADAAAGTLPAEGLPQELAGSQLVSPDRQAVPAVPGSGLPPRRLLRTVSRTPAVAGQRVAARMPARVWRSVWHKITPTKKARPNDSAESGKSLALALKARALDDIKHDLGFAIPAIGRQPAAFRVRPDFSQALIFTALRAAQPPIAHIKHFTTRFHRFQRQRASFS